MGPVEQRRCRALCSGGGVGVHRAALLWGAQGAGAIEAVPGRAPGGVVGGCGAALFGVAWGVSGLA